MPIPAAARDLPVLEVLDELGRALTDRREAVVVAPPGAGKTTVVPLWLLDQPWLGGGRIVVLEPRRLATRAAARRMASLLGESVGDTVGYQTRDERHIGPRTRIEVVTEGVLTRRLQNDPELPGTAVVVFDEVHERNLPTDMGLAFVLDARASLRPDLRIVAMSATPDAVRIARLLGTDASPAPVVESDGRTFPIDVRWAPMGKGVRLEHAVTDVVLRALRDEIGDLLVFLPGIGEIRRVEQALQDRVPGGVDLRPLAGALSLAEQDLALDPSDPGRRRVVLSTDIAESSLTVAGVRVVVDAGLAKVPRFDARSGMTKLTTISTSRASADQRAGRAGRTEPGVAYRLWSKLEHGTRLAHLPAEITQVELADVALELAAWPGDSDDLRFIDPPPAKALLQARELLRQLSGLDDDDRITPLGRRMLELPVHPRLGRMIAMARGDDQGLACALAAIVDERDVLRGRADDLPADIALRVRLVAGSEQHERADRRAVQRLRDRARDLAHRAGVRAALDDIDDERSGAVLALAYPDRIAIRRSQLGSFQLRSGNGAWVGATDPLAGEAFIVAADLDGNRTNARIRLGAAIAGDDVAESLADQVERRESLVWEKQRNDLVLRIEHRLGSMLLRESIGPASPGSDTVAALVDRVTATRLAALAWTDAAVDLRARVAFLRRLDEGTEHAERWPDWSDRRLLATVSEWLEPYLVRATGAADLAALDTSMLLENHLDWDAQMELASLVPRTLETPAGRPTPIDYTRERPTASVRVQDLFGLGVHPTVAGGRVPLTLELLSPAGRPIQITDDLPGFWHGSWAEVRKEMAGRYPKHQWPVDPSTAPPKRMKDR